MAYKNIIENVDLNKTLKLEGSKWDNTLIRNVTIHDTSGDGILLRNVENVRIENSEFRDIGGSGIRLSMSGSTDNVTIVNNTISGTGKNGINAGQRYENGVDHTNLKILNNHVDSTGRDSDGGLKHGLYIQGSDFLIEGNTVTNSLDGNGISVRTSGVIRGNTVDGTGKSGISYYSDHMKGPSNTLVIEDNEVSNWGNNNSKRGGIDLLEVTDMNQAVKNFVIKDNELGPSKNGGDPIRIHKDYQSSRFDIDMSGNGDGPADGPADPIESPEPTPEIPNGEDIIGTSRDDTLIGTDAAEKIVGKGGNDTIQGNGGDDTLVADSSFDRNDLDEFIFTSIEDGHDVIWNFDASGSKHDTLNLDRLFDSLGSDYDTTKERKAALEIDGGSDNSAKVTITDYDTGEAFDSFSITLLGMNVPANHLQLGTDIVF